MNFINIFRRFWHFLWRDDSWSSWIVSLVILVLFVKFVFYPGLGFIFGTGFPVVAVLSESMEHNSFFDDWWNENHDWYSERNFTQDMFKDYKLHNGFNKGDIIILLGVSADEVKLGDIIVYNDYIHIYPIIHRVVDIKVNITENRKSYKFQTKGDNNFRRPDLFYVNEEQVLGRAFLRVPLLGWVKIWATDIFNFVVGGFKK
jgi:signal peptidase I